MGMALLHRHEMGDYLQRQFLTPHGYAGVCGNARLVLEDRQKRPAVAGAATADQGPAPAEEGPGRDHLNSEHAAPKRAA